MAAVYSQLLSVQDRPARVWRGGTTGKPLVLLHGEMGDAAAHWRWCWEALAQTYSLYAPDLPGFGGMTAALPDPGMPALMDWTFALLDALQLPAVALVGNSFGATLARLAAANPPARISRLVLVNGGGLNALPEGALAALPVLGGAFGGRGAVSPQTLDKAIHGGAWLTPDFVAEARRGLAAFGAMGSGLARARGPRTAAPPCPVLLVWGTQDRLAPLKSAQALLKELPGAALRPIEHAGRMPQMEQTDAFLAAVRDFVPARSRES